jgi:hypothetical protein
MEINMAAKDFLSDGSHFIMLDVSNNVNENGITKKYPTIHIVDQLDKILHQNIETVRTRVGNVLMFEEKREDLFTITLNTAEDYKNQLFR